MPTARKGPFIHGASSNKEETTEYVIWKGMKQRCSNPKHVAYRMYGGRGITVCERWRVSFTAFYADMGPRPSKGHSIDRIDNERGYEPGNVRWATSDVQGANRRRRGPDLVPREHCSCSIRELAATLGVNRHRLAAHFRAGRTFMDYPLTPPPRGRDSRGVFV